MTGAYQYDDGTRCEPEFLGCMHFGLHYADLAGLSGDQLTHLAFHLAAEVRARRAAPERTVDVLADGLALRRGPDWLRVLARAAGEARQERERQDVRDKGVSERDDLVAEGMNDPAGFTREISRG